MTILDFVPNCTVKFILPTIANAWLLASLTFTIDAVFRIRLAVSGGSSDFLMKDDPAPVSSTAVCRCIDESPCPTLTCTL